MNPAVTVLGAHGQLGSDLCAAFASGWKVVALDREELNVVSADAQALLAAVRGAAVVVNCTGYTNVDRAETDRDAAFALNADAVRKLAEACRSTEAHFIHISTDYVFDGAKGAPYVESDAAHPINVYGESKLLGERYAAGAPRHAIVRTCGLYGKHPSIGKGGANFVQKVLQRARTSGELEVVSDEFVSPTYTVDLAAQLVRVAERQVTGIIHAAAHGPVSWFEFAKAAVEIAGVRAVVRPTTAARYPTAARRPAFSALKNERLKQLAMDEMPSWRDGLERYLVSPGSRLR